MTTNKHRVQAYISSEIFDNLRAKATQAQLSLSAYIEQVLVESISIDSQLITKANLKSALEAIIIPMVEKVTQSESPEKVTQSDSPEKVTQSDSPEKNALTLFHEDNYWLVAYRFHADQLKGAFPELPYSMRYQDGFKAVSCAFPSKDLVRVSRLRELFDLQIIPAHEKKSPPPIVPDKQHPDPIFQKLYGIVMIDGKAVSRFWNGKTFVEDPTKLKVFKNPLTKRSLAKAEGLTKLFKGEMRHADLERILLNMNYPYGFQQWSTTVLEELWRESNLVREV